MPDPGNAWRILHESELVCSAEEVSHAIKDLAGRISTELADKYPVVLSVMGGAVFFAGQVLPLFHFPLDFDYIHVTRYGDAIVGTRIDWRVAPPESVRGRTVLVLDDILDGGHTMAAIRGRILDLGATSFYCAVLIEKVLAVPKPIAADFVGLKIPDRFVFGCGMDARGYWRNLPDIHALKEK